MSEVLSKSIKSVMVLSMFGALSVYADADSKNVCGKEGMEGFNVGVDLMYSHTNVKHETNFSDWIDGAGVYGYDETPWHEKTKRCALESVVNAGYSTFFRDKFFVGLSAEVALGKNSKHNTVCYGNIPTELRIHGDSYEIKAKGGYYFEGICSVVYGICGVKWRKADLKYIHTSEYSRAKLKTPAVVFGIGMEKPVCEKLSMVAEYEYTWRRSTKRSVAANPSLLGDQYDSVVFKQSLHDNSLRIGLKYHF